MKVKMVTVIMDDDNTECRIGDTVLVRTKKIQDFTPAKIKDIAVTFLTLEFDDPYIGYRSLKIRTNDILKCKKYN